MHPSQAGLGAHRDQAAAACLHLPADAGRRELLCIPRQLGVCRWRDALICWRGALVIIFSRGAGAAAAGGLGSKERSNRSQIVCLNSPTSAVPSVAVRQGAQQCGPPPSLPRRPRCAPAQRAPCGKKGPSGSRRSSVDSTRTNWTAAARMPESWEASACGNCGAHVWGLSQQRWAATPHCQLAVASQAPSCAGRGSQPEWPKAGPEQACPRRALGRALVHPPRTLSAPGAPSTKLPASAAAAPGRPWPSPWGRQLPRRPASTPASATSDWCHSLPATGRSEGQRWRSSGTQSSVAGLACTGSGALGPQQEGWERRAVMAPAAGARR